MFPVRTHYDFAGEGFRGSELFRKNNCTSCHRAVGNGTSMGLNLDGIGSRHDLDYLLAFLRDPEATYPSRTVEHGAPPKDASYVSRLPEADRHAIAVFLSQLRADRGSASAEAPPPGKSGFLDAMLDMWAPDSWRIAFHDVRDKDAAPDATKREVKDGSATAPQKEGSPQGNTR
jgi:cytochrome c553